MNFNSALPVNTIIEPETHPDQLINVYQQFDEDQLVRVQSDIPLPTRAYITGLFGKRGNIQAIINTTFHILEHELRSIGLAGYDTNNDAIVARILLQLRGTASRVHHSEDRTQPDGGNQNTCRESDVDELVWGSIERESRVDGGLTSAQSNADTTAPASNRGRHAEGDPQTPRDADGSRNAKSKPAKGSGSNRVKGPKRQTTVKS